MPIGSCSAFAYFKQSIFVYIHLIEGSNSWLGELFPFKEMPHTHNCTPCWKGYENKLTPTCLSSQLCCFHHNLGALYKLLVLSLLSVLQSPHILLFWSPWDSSGVLASGSYRSSACLPRIEYQGSISYHLHGHLLSNADIPSQWSIASSAQPDQHFPLSLASCHPDVMHFF